MSAHTQADAYTAVEAGSYTATLLPLAGPGLTPAYNAAVASIKTYTYTSRTPFTELDLFLRISHHRFALCPFCSLATSTSRDGVECVLRGKAVAFRRRPRGTEIIGLGRGFSEWSGDGDNDTVS